MHGTSELYNDEIRYEVLIESLRDLDAQNKTEAFSEFATIIGQKNLKSFQEKLIRASIADFKKGPIYGEGPHNLIGYRLSQRQITPESETDNYSPLKAVEIMAELISSEEGNFQVRNKLLNKVLESGMCTDTIMEYIKTKIFNSEHNDEQDEYFNEARDIVFSRVSEVISTNLQANPSETILRDFVLDLYASNSLPEGIMWRMSRSIKTGGQKYPGYMLAAAKSDTITVDLKSFILESLAKPPIKKNY